MNQIALNYTAKLPSSKPLKIGSIKSNRWVMYGGVVGIVTDMTEDSATATFNAVGDDGVTVASTSVDPFELIEATWEQIPEIRRPTKEAAYNLGYALPE